MPPLLEMDIIDIEQKEIDRYQLIPGSLVRLALGLVNSIVRLLVRFHVKADHITMAGAYLSLNSLPLLAQGYFTWGAILLLAGGLCDLLDGAVARLSNTCSPVSQRKDFLADRLSDAAPLVGLFCFFSNGDNNMLHSALAAGALEISLRISYIKRLALQIKLYKPCAGILQRQHRLLLLVFGLLLCGAYPLPPQVATPTVLFFFGPQVILVWPLTLVLIIILLLGTITFTQRLVSAILGTANLRTILSIFRGETSPRAE